jgi:hypothetical protein
LIEKELTEALQTVGQRRGWSVANFHVAPVFVSAETMPNLSQLAGGGVFFANHHPVYSSATEVNGTAFVAFREHEAQQL